MARTTLLLVVALVPVLALAGGRRKKAVDPLVQQSQTVREPGNLWVKEFSARTTADGTTYAVTVCHDPVQKQVTTWMEPRSGGARQQELVHAPEDVFQPLSFSIGIYHHREGHAPACGAEPDVRHRMEWTPTDQQRCAGFGASPAPRPDGTGPAWALADVECELGDLLDKDDSDDHAIEKPELMVEVVRRKLPAKPTAFDRSAITGTRLELRVCNEGYRTPTGVELGLRLGGPFTDQVVPAAPPDPRRVATQRIIKPLDTGECRAVTYDLSVEGAGRYSGWVFVDPGSTIDEQDETNNSAGFAYQKRVRGNRSSTRER